MQVDFVRFEATDSVELQGWLTDAEDKTAVVHIHGMSGNGYENRFLDSLRDAYVANDITFFAIDTRGRGISSSFRQGDDTKLGGSCFEIFEESTYDIQGAIDYLKSQGKTRFILQGHSLGCTKVVNYCATNDISDIIKVVLLAPTDMTGWAKTESKHEEYLRKAKQLLSENNGQELVGAQCWLDKTPLSAQTYPTICEAGSSADIYGEREGGALLGEVEKPMLVVYGTEDIGITRIDGSIENWQSRVDSIKNQSTSISTINGAGHGFRGYEDKLAETIKGYIAQ